MNQVIQTTANSLGYWAIAAITKHSKKFRKHEADVLADRDREALHQMRVGMRRLRSALKGFAPALNLPKAAKEKQVAAVARQLGELRDLDVLSDRLQNHYLKALPLEEQAQLALGLKVLAKRRSKALKRVQETLAGKRYQKLKQGLEDWLEQPHLDAIAAAPIETVLPDLLLPEVSRLFLHPGWLVGVSYQGEEIQISDSLEPSQAEQLLHQQGETLHSLRKQAKRSRYQMELFKSFYGEAYQDYCQQIKAIQDVLGQVQDSLVLSEFLAQVFDAPFWDRLPTLAQMLTNERYAQWQQWQILQRQLLSPQVRQDLRSTLEHPVSSPEPSEPSPQPQETV